MSKNSPPITPLENEGLSRQRADLFLVQAGYFPSRARARAEIDAGSVTVDGAVLTKANKILAPGCVIEISGAAIPYVSRGGLKLAHGFDHFGLDPSGMSALDLGASTGGFTDVLLRRGAGHVTAVDVGHGQFHDSLKNDARVTNLEGLNARDLTAEHLPKPPQIIVSDVSFISLTLALPPALRLAAPGAWLIALIKPQFEAGRENVGKSGVVKDPAIRAEICARIKSWLDDKMGWHVVGITPSPILGPEGNEEFLIGARKTP